MGNFPDLGIAHDVGIAVIVFEPFLNISRDLKGAGVS